MMLCYTVCPAEGNVPAALSGTIKGNSKVPIHVKGAKPPWDMKLLGWEVGSAIFHPLRRVIGQAGSQRRQPHNGRGPYLREQ